MSDNELKLLWAKATQKGWDLGWIPGILGRLNSDGTVTIEVDGKPGWVHVRMGPDGSQGHVIARNEGVALRANTPVKMRRENGVLVVHGVDGQRGFVHGGGNGAGGGVGQHTHRIGSGYEYELEALRLEMGRVRHYSGMQVYIGAFRYQKSDGTWDTWPGGILDLTSYAPSTSGNHAWVLVGVDPSDNTAIAVTGTEYSYVTPLVADLIDDITFTDYLPCGAVRVRADDTTLSSISRYQDAHGWFTGGTGSSGASSTNWAEHKLRILHRLSWIGLSAHGTLEKFGTLGEPDVTNPVIAVGTGGDSDLKIREIGNVLFEPWEGTRRYKIFYTGYNSGASTDEKIHYAYSEDGKTWTKSASNPVISSRRAEDPYVVNEGGVYYLYAEDKEAGGQDKLRRWHSSDCETWIDDGQITLSDAGEAQSPVVWVEAGTWYMLYEQYPTTPNDIRLATSTDGLSWTVEATNPVFLHSDTTWVGSGEAVVADDIIKVGRTYYMLYHGYTGSAWRGGLASSTNLTSWTDLGSPIVGDSFDSISGAILYDNRLTFYYYDGDGTDTSGIYRGFPIDPILTISSGAITVNGDYYIIAAQSGTSDDLDTINGGEFRQFLLIQADSGDTITVKDGTGNINLNGGSDFALSGDKSLLLLWDGDSWADVGAGGGSPLDFSTLTEELNIDGVNDEAAFYDNSAGAHRKVPPWRFQSSSRMIYAATADQEVVNTTDETTLLGDGSGTLTIPANSLIAGSVITIVARGQMTDTGTPTINIKASLGGTQICATGAQALTGISAIEWRVEITMTVRVIGASGTVVGGGLFDYDEGTELAIGSGSGITIDTTGALDVDLTATWGTADASNTILAREAIVRIDNPPPGNVTAGADARITEGADTRITESGDARVTEGV